MEKSVRAAIQRHQRGWSPYPHVRVTTTPVGHRVRWVSAKDMLDAAAYVEIETTGTPSRSDFSILSVLGTRTWDKTDVRIMENDPNLEALVPWSSVASPARIAALDADACVDTLANLRLSWARNASAKKMLDLVEAQSFSPAVALRTSLDVLAAASTPEALHEPKTQMECLARIALGHAMDSKRKAWACKFGHAEAGRWNDMTLVAWQDPGGWNLTIGPRDNPILFSDYHWQDTPGGLVFYDRLPSGAPEETMRSRGSYERYARSQHTLDNLAALHWEALHAVLSSKTLVVEPDSAWTKPVKAALKKGLDTSTSISPEYHSFIRSFEEKAFGYLASKAMTSEGKALGMRMTIGRSLDEPSQTVADFQHRLMAWGLAMTNGFKKEDMVVDGSVFEGLGA